MQGLVGDIAVWDPVVGGVGVRVVPQDLEHGREFLHLLADVFRYVGNPLCKGKGVYRLVYLVRR